MAADLQDPQNSVSEPSAFPKRDFRQEVTDQIIEMLEKGTAPWQTPWEPGALQLPHNPTTNRAYRGGNALHLMAVSARKGFDDSRWLTYRQAQENGWQVRKGEKGSQIEFWQFDASGKPAPGQEDNDAPPDRNVNANAGPIRRVYTVFNAKQIDGIPIAVTEHRQSGKSELRRGSRARRAATSCPSRVGRARPGRRCAVGGRA